MIFGWMVFKFSAYTLWIYWPTGNYCCAAPLAVRFVDIHRTNACSSVLLRPPASCVLQKQQDNCKDWNENNSDHPHPPYEQKNMTPKYAIKWGVVWRTNPLKWRDFHRECGARTDFYGIRTPTFMAYGPPLLRHMNRFYWGWGWSLICWWNS